MQKWSFESEPVIRIGRVDDNHVVLFSSVVSRHHAELRRQPRYWEIVGLGANGTFINGEKITQAKIFLDSSETIDNIPESPVALAETSEPKVDLAKERKTFLAPRRD
jgi:pSer/pThr/pTyr-binding forkhead associated (FHA) protein